MVRRVRPGRRDADRRPRRLSRWAGPPPLLLAATVLGFVVAPFVAEQPTLAAAQPTAAVQSGPGPRYVEPRIVRGLQLSPARAGQAGGGVRPVELAPVDLGVVSMNALYSLPADEARDDIQKVTSRDDVDVIGWQEASRIGPALHQVSGWTTRTFTRDGANSEVAVSWRSAEFTLVSARQVDVAPGVAVSRGSYPFAARLVAVVTLRHRETGRLLTVIDTHLPRRIEDVDDPGRWAPTLNAQRAQVQLRRMAAIWERSGARWVIGTGDFNFDAGSAASNHSDSAPLSQLSGTAVSTYQKLGIPAVPTHPPSGRHIDYVWLDRDDDESGEITLRGQQVLRDYHSDHNPLLARLRLS